MPEHWRSILPARIVAQHSDVRVVRLGLRRRQENEARLQTGSHMCLPDQLSTDSSPLKRHVNREIRQIGAVVEVCNRPRHAHQQPSGISRGDDDIGIRKHSSHRRASSTGPRSASVDRRRTSINSSTVSLGSNEYSISAIFAIFQSANLPIFQCAPLQTAHQRPREARRPSAALQADLEAIVDVHGRASLFERGARLRIAIQHHALARAQRQHITSHRVELVVRHLDEPIPTIAAVFAETHQAASANRRQPNRGRRG